MFGKRKEEGTGEPPAEEAKPAAGGSGDAGVPGETGGSNEPPEESVESEASEKPAEPEQPAESEKPAEPEPSAEPDWKMLYAVTRADFENYKKRAARDREDVYRYAESDILKDILPTVDTIQMALDKAENKEDPFVKGIQLVSDGLLKALERHGVKPMGDLVGKDLDPNLHEAIATLPHAEIEEGKITNVVKSGWLINDKLLRAAQVVTSTGRPA